jgi:hypothetical protein
VASIEISIFKNLARHLPCVRISDPLDESLNSLGIVFERFGRGRSRTTTREEAITMESSISNSQIESLISPKDLLHGSGVAVTAKVLDFIQTVRDAF